MNYNKEAKSLTFRRGSYMNYNKEAKSLTSRRGSEVGQVVKSLRAPHPFRV